MTDHHPRQELDGPRRRWTCPACPWSTPWTLYTDPHAGPAAVRHALDNRRTLEPIEAGR